MTDLLRLAHIDRYVTYAEVKTSIGTYQPLTDQDGKPVNLFNDLEAAQESRHRMFLEGTGPMRTITCMTRCGAL